MNVSYSIVPVGHGFIGLMTMGDTVILTDGGTMKRKHFFDIAYHNFITAMKTYGVKVDRTSWRWVISHLDYDHISLTSLYFDSMGLKVDECYLPGVLSISICREAVASFMALQHLLAYEFGLMDRLPDKPEAVVNALNTCKKKTAVAQGDNIRFNNDVVYHVIWPSNHRASEKCKLLIELTLKIVEEYCRKHYKTSEDINRCLEIYKKHLNEIKPFFSNIEHYYYAEYAEHRPEQPAMISGIDTDSRFKYTTFRNRIYIPRKYSEHFQLSNRIEKLLSRRGFVYLANLYNVLRSEYTDLTALAYAVVHSNRGSSITLDFYSNIVQFIFSSNSLIHVGSPIKLLYLSDLKGWALREALNYYLTSVKLPNREKPAVLVAPHHGTAWEDALKQLTPCITAIPSRLIRNVKINRYRNLTSLTLVFTDLHTGITVSF